MLGYIKLGDNECLYLMHCATLYSGVTNHSAVFGHMNTENTVGIKKILLQNVLQIPVLLSQVHRHRRLSLCRTSMASETMILDSYNNHYSPLSSPTRLLNNF